MWNQKAALTEVLASRLLHSRISGGLAYKLPRLTRGKPELRERGATKFRRAPRSETRIICPTRSVAARKKRESYLPAAASITKPPPYPQLTWSRHCGRTFCRQSGPAYFPARLTRFFPTYPKTRLLPWYSLNPLFSQTASVGPFW